MACSGPRLPPEMDHMRAEDVGYVIECPPGDLPEVIWILEDTDDDCVSVLISSDEEDEGEVDDVGDVLDDWWDDADLPSVFGNMEIDVQGEEDGLEDQEDSDLASEDSGYSTCTENSEFSEDEDDGDDMRPLSPAQPVLSQDLFRAERPESPNDVPVISVSGVHEVGTHPHSVSAAGPQVRFDFGSFGSISSEEPVAKRPKLEPPEESLPSSSGVISTTPKTMEEGCRHSAPSTSGLSSSSIWRSAPSTSGLNSSTWRSYGHGPFGPSWFDDSDSD